MQRIFDDVFELKDETSIAELLDIQIHFSSFSYRQAAVSFSPYAVSYTTTSKFIAMKLEAEAEETCVTAGNKKQG